MNKDFDEQLAKLHEIHPNIQVFPAGHEEQRKKKVPAKLDHPCVKVISVFFIKHVLNYHNITNR